MASRRQTGFGFRHPFTGLEDIFFLWYYGPVAMVKAYNGVIWTIGWNGLGQRGVVGDTRISNQSKYLSYKCNISHALFCVTNVTSVNTAASET